MAYVVREHDHSNVATGRLDELGLQAGPWLKVLKDPATGDEAVETADRGRYGRFGILNLLHDSQDYHRL